MSSKWVRLPASTGHLKEESRGKQVTQREIDLAIEAIVRGYGFQRSFTHPYLFEKVDGLWRMYDEPRKKGGERREEFISHRMDPTDVHAVARKHARGHYCLCPIHGPDDDADLIRDTYKDLGYRLNHTEFFMIHSLSRIPRVVSPVTLKRVTAREWPNVSPRRQPVARSCPSTSMPKTRPCVSMWLL